MDFKYVIFVICLLFFIKLLQGFLLPLDVAFQQHVFVTPTFDFLLTSMYMHYHWLAYNMGLFCTKLGHWVNQGQQHGFQSSSSYSMITNVGSNFFI
jgi:hypothetical protein